jgi:hypothetical protein
MKPQDILNALVAARGLPQDVETIPGSFVHRIVSKHLSQLRDILPQVENLSTEDQLSFIKSLALYEQAAGGLGSTTLLFHAFQYVDDSDHKMFDWVLANTTSYEYYACGAKSYAELQQREEESSKRTAANLEREAQRAAEAKVRRAKKASANLINAIKRGDIKAVEALLRQGASTDISSSTGLSAADFADKVGHPAISHLIRGWHNVL